MNVYGKIFVIKDINMKIVSIYIVFMYNVFNNF